MRFTNQTQASVGFPFVVKWLTVFIIFNIFLYYRHACLKFGDSAASCGTPLTLHRFTLFAV